MPDPLSDEQITAALDGLPEWTRRRDALVREVEVARGDDAVLEENVRHVADAFDHHPEVTATDSALRLSLTTHAAGGITARDIEVAAAIDQVISGSAPEERSPEPD